MKKKINHTTATISHFGTYFKKLFSISSFVNLAFDFFFNMLSLIKYHTKGTEYLIKKY
jgi:hypothetical protein